MIKPILVLFLILTFTLGTITPYTAFADEDDDEPKIKFKKHKVHTGDGPPPQGLGKVGDLYIDSSDTDNLVIYKKTAKKTWTSLGSFQGQQGPPGAPGQDGTDGQSCWDLNNNGIGDLPEEDTNGDNVVDVFDCQGLPGNDGQDGTDGQDGIDGADGLNCWDLNGDGVANLPAEDTNSDGIVDVLDCKGPKGDKGDKGDPGDSEVREVECIDPTLNPNWVSIIGFQGVQACKNSDGLVTITGAARFRTGSFTITNLPEGFGPSERLTFVAAASNDPVRVDIFANGDVTVGGSIGSGAFVSLSGISYYVP